MEERLQKYLASCGIASRRQSENLISQGKVKVNGQIVTTVGIKINPNKDRIEYNDKIVNPPKKCVYYALNKPKGFTTTTADPHAEKIVTDLVPEEPRVFPVGRLDKDTTGLILLTNDGAIANILTHPRYEHEKEYIVTLKVTEITNRIYISNAIAKFSQGVKLDDGMTLPAKVSDVHFDNQICRFHITLKEGRKQQIRRMIQSVNLTIINLHRIRINKLNLGNIPEGKYRLVSKEEII